MEFWKWLVLLIFIFSPGCSSAPKKPAEVFTERTVAENQLEMANRAAVRGHYQEALAFLLEARRLAVLTDDPQLRLRTAICRGDILFSSGRADDAFREWENAGTEGDASGEKELAALSRLHAIRARLVLLDSASSSGGPTNNAAAEELKNQLAREMPVFNSGSLSMAAAYVTLGMAEKYLGRWAAAEDAAKRALAIHEKGLFLEEAAYDWYLIASIRSMAGNYDAALEALKTSIAFDRRAENGSGLASTWHAMGDVYKKAGRSEESQAAYRRAAEIYRALGLEEKAEAIGE